MNKYTLTHCCYSYYYFNKCVLASGWYPGYMKANCTSPTGLPSPLLGGPLLGGKLPGPPMNNTGSSDWAIKSSNSLRSSSSSSLPTVDVGDRLISSSGSGWPDEVGDDDGICGGDGSGGGRGSGGGKNCGGGGGKNCGGGGGGKSGRGMKGG